MVSPKPQFNVPEDIPATEMVWVDLGHYVRGTSRNFGHNVRSRTG